MMQRRNQLSRFRLAVSASRFLAAVLLLTAAGAAAVEAVRVASVTEPADDRGAGLVRERYQITLPTARLNYQFLRREDDDRVVVGKHGDHALGLEFGRRLGNGGWNLWKFLSVNVRGADGRPGDATAVAPPLGVCVLEAEKRAMVELVWPLEQVAPGAELAVRLLQTPGLADWLFVEVRIHGADTTPVVVLSCYPGNTSGPMTRERWLFAGGKRQTLHAGAVRLESPAGAVLYYNRYAQERDGCRLVWLPDEVASVSVTGTYGIQTTLQPVPGRGALHVALGYFNDTASEDAMRGFAGETPDQVRLLLAATSWQAEVDRERPTQILGELDRLLHKAPVWPGVPEAERPMVGRKGPGGAGSQTFGERHAALARDLHAAGQQGRERDFVQAAAAAAGLQQELYEESLRLLR